ncbi:MAG: tetratricopeptide repeat protein [Nitrospinae bacterium]|nr:tetratricopeptide repeat protein [Nitrospinota bacterium]
MKKLKFLPHLSLIALIAFLMTDTSSFVSKTPSIAKKNSGPVEEGSHHEGSHEEGSKGKALSQEEKEKRMGIFHYNEGNKNFKAGQFEEAIINYKKALHHNKNFKEATINLSTAYMKNSDFDAALKTLQKGMMLDPKNPHIHYNYACYYSLMGQPGTSLEKLKEAIEFGFGQFKQIETDPDLENLRQSVEYKTWAQTLNI